MNNIDAVELHLNTDCRDAMDQMSDNMVHLILTDPPYFLDSLDSDQWEKVADKNKSAAVGKLPAGMKFDAKQGKKLQQFMHHVGLKMLRVLRPGGFVLCFSQPRLTHRMTVGLEDAGFQIRDVYTWHYTKFTQMKAFSMNHFVRNRSISDVEKEDILRILGNRKTCQVTPLGEHVILAQKPAEMHLADNYVKWRTGLINADVRLNGKLPHTVMHVEKERLRFEWLDPKIVSATWVTPKPTALLKHLIKVFSSEGQVVLDPFLGSGSTAIAAHHTDRRCIGMELNPVHSEVIKRRLDYADIPWRLCEDAARTLP